MLGALGAANGFDLFEQLPRPRLRGALSAAVVIRPFDAFEYRDRDRLIFRVLAP